MASRSSEVSRGGRRCDSLAHALLAGQILFADQQRKDAVFTRRIVVVQVPIAQPLSIDPLCDQCLQAVLDGIGVAIVGEADSQAIQQTDAFIYLAQQQSADI